MEWDKQAVGYKDKSEFIELVQILIISQHAWDEEGA